jgi:hypothetical protein
LTVNGYTPDEQCGFLPEKDTATAIIAYLELLKACHVTNTALHAMYVDFTKAYDKVQHWVLQAILIHLNFPTNLRKAIVSMIGNCKTSFKTAYGPTKPVDLKVGVKQGDPLSPILFLIYMLPLQWSLRQTQTFFNINFPSNHLCYADDLLLIANKESDMRTLYKTLESYANLTDMEIKPEKSAYTNINSQSNFNPTVKGVPIPKLPPHKTYKYLGVQVSGDLTWSTAIDEVLTKHKKSVELIMSKHYLSTDNKIKLINSVANATPAYLFQFISTDLKKIEQADKHTIKLLNKSINISSQKQEQYWPLIRKLVTLTDLATQRYTEECTLFPP